MLGESISTEPRADLKCPASQGPTELVDLVLATGNANLNRVSTALAACRELLLDRGVAPVLLDAIASSLTSGDWNDAVSAFADTRNAEVVFYLGPMRPREHAAVSLGLVFGRRDPIASHAFEVVRQDAENLGRSLFGFPCSFRGRQVEFFRLDAVGGCAVGENEASIALFTPFYLGGWTEPALRTRERCRTILWSNVVVERHKAVARPLARERLVINEEVPAITQCSEPELYACTGLWLALHELFHGSGPLPLFEPASNKAEIAGYGVVEESRVDMSAFVALSHHERYGRLSRAAAELIFVERVLRSARRGAHDIATSSTISLDGGHGLVWAGALLRSGALVPGRRTSPARLNFDPAVEAITNTLRTVYEAESATIDVPGERRTVLSAMAAEWTSSFLGAHPSGLAALSGLPPGPALARLLPAPTVRAGPRHRGHHPPP